MPTEKIYPKNGYALRGRIVTLNDDRKILDDGVIIIQDGVIVHVQEAGELPEGLDNIPVIQTGGTIFPGMIELHNHLAYNVLPLWKVPRRFDRRSTWSSKIEKKRWITWPMKVLSVSGYTPDVVRYSECKCLVAGVTTSQGITLSNTATKDLFKGIVRNTKAPGTNNLPQAQARISDIDKDEFVDFYNRLHEKVKTCYLLHLCEGLNTDKYTTRHFQALKGEINGEEEWAITNKLAGIHCTGLTPDDFEIFGEKEGAMIWSPMSNLALYGATADIQTAKKNEILISLGSDWSPSGSKNLLCEMKVAYLVSEEAGGVFTPQEIVEMVTINPAKTLKWQDKLGSIEQGKYADLLVLDNQTEDAYEQLIKARETSVKLVSIHGVPRYGVADLMNNFVGSDEMEVLSIDNATWKLDLREENAHEDIKDLKLQTALENLEGAFENLAGLATEIDNNPANALLANFLGCSEDFQEVSTIFFEAFTEGGFDTAAIPADYFDNTLLLDLDNEGPGYYDPENQPPDAESLFDLTRAVNYGDELRDVTITIDALTTVEDEHFFQTIAEIDHLPAFIKTDLPGFYGRDPQVPGVATKFKTSSNKVNSIFSTTVPLAKFRDVTGSLSKSHRERIIEQAIILMEQIYVHLPMKRSMYAVDPVQRLKLLLYKTQTGYLEFESELDFHNEISRTFASVRDLHTNYMLPHPFRDAVAFLPFVLEEYFDEKTSRWRYVVTKVFGEHPDPNFKKKAEILYWNGTQIERAVDLNAGNEAGGNPSARHARGLYGMTFRPLISTVPPSEDWVTLEYIYKYKKKWIRKTIEFEWLVFYPYRNLGGIGKNEKTSLASAKSYDLTTDAIHQIRKMFFARKTIGFDEYGNQRIVVNRGEIETNMPSHFRAKIIQEKKEDYAYVRIFNFMVPDPDQFVDEFIFLLDQLPQNGLIIDIRGNPGGSIPAAEFLLQALAPYQRPILAQRAQFINSPLTYAICDQNEEDASNIWKPLSLQAWKNSIRKSVQTNAVFSKAFSITQQDEINEVFDRTRKHIYPGPIVLITDALCYSAADLFAAGFQDYNLGKILGVDEHTGAGGANVWTHELLSMLMWQSKNPPTPLKNSPFKPLPFRANLRVAVRRFQRLNGDILEDYGVTRDVPYRMTRKDLFQGNKLLIKEAIKVLTKIKLENNNEKMTERIY